MFPCTSSSFRTVDRATVLIYRLRGSRHLVHMHVPDKLTSSRFLPSILQQSLHFKCFIRFVPSMDYFTSVKVPDKIGRCTL